jgi:hypothetical protein
LGAFFQGFWAALQAELGPPAPLLDALIEQAKTIWRWFTDLLGPVQASGDTWTAWGVNAGTALGAVIGTIAAWAGTNSGLITTIAALYGSWLALRLIWVLPIAPFARCRSCPAWIGTGPLMALLKGIKLLGGAFLRLGLLALANPIGLIIASVGALALVVYQNWDKITAYLGDKIETVRASFEVGVLNGVFTALSEFNPFVLTANGLKGLLKYIAELTHIPESIVTAFGSFSLYDPGIALMQSLWDGMASILPRLVASIKAKLVSLKPQWITDQQNWVGAVTRTTHPHVTMAGRCAPECPIRWANARLRSLCQASQGQSCPRGSCARRWRRVHWPRRSPQKARRISPPARH